jgi:hypothetical protein
MATFLIIGVVGVVLLLASVVLGEVFDGIFDAIGSDVISGASIAVFLGAFGFAGALILGATDNTGIAVGGGVVAGLAFGAGAGWFTAKLRQGGDESNVRTSSLSGRDAVVVSEIPDNGYGEVSVTVAGHITKLNARADGPMRAGTPVTITAVLSATAVHVGPREPGPMGPGSIVETSPKGT